MCNYLVMVWDLFGGRLEDLGLLHCARHDVAAFLGEAVLAGALLGVVGVQT